MKSFEFELIFALADRSGDPELWLDALFEAGCDDALVATGQHGYIVLEFCREARTARAAMSSAIRDVNKAIPEAELIEAKPDLVSLTDISRLFGFTRQAARKLATDARRMFPEPAHTGQTALWHLADVLGWAAETRQPVAVEEPENLYQVGVAAMESNATIQATRARKRMAAARGTAKRRGFVSLPDTKARGGSKASRKQRTPNETNADA